MLSRARHIALGLHSLGLRKDDRVAILSDSCVEWVLADQGCIFSGVIYSSYLSDFEPRSGQIHHQRLRRPGGFRFRSWKSCSELETTLKDCATIENGNHP